MGKFRSKKRFSGPTNRPTPTGISPTISGDTTSAGIRGGEDVWQTITSQLHSESSEDRECGCASLSMFGSRVDAATKIVERRLVRIVARLLDDKNVSVRHAAVGALKNISLSSPEICDGMVKQDVMAPLTNLITGLSDSGWRPQQGGGGERFQIDSSLEIFVGAVDVLRNLCEANDAALAAFVKSRVPAVLFAHADVGVYGPKVVVPVLQCLYAASEDARERMVEFEPVVASLRQRPAASPADLHVRLLATGIAVNTLTHQTADILPEVMATLGQVLDQDHRKLVHDYSSAIPLSDDGSVGNLEAEPRLDELRSDIDNVVLAQQAALEMLANLCSGEESADDWDVGPDDSDESSDVEAMDDDDTGSGVPAVVVEAISAHGMVDKVVARAGMPADNVVEILQSRPGRKAGGGLAVLRMLSALRSRAFLCLNNIVDALAADDLGGQPALARLWAALGSALFSGCGGGDEEAVEAASCAMRAVAHKLTGGPADPSSDLDRIINLARSSASPTVRANAVRIAGSLGRGCCLPDAAARARVGCFLADTAAGDIDLRVVAESLDQIFDMFADDDTDRLCADIDLVPSLRRMLPGLGVKLSMRGRRRGDEAAALAAMAKTNLVRFVKYKERRLALLQQQQQQQQQQPC